MSRPRPWDNAVIQAILVLGVLAVMAAVIVAGAAAIGRWS